MAQYRCDHLHLRSPNPARLAAFFTGMFDATITGELRQGDGLRLILDLGGLTLFIERVPPGTPAPPAPPFLGVEHVGLSVTGFDAAVAALREKGARFVVEPTSPRPGTWIAFIEGPDNVRVEILERTPA